MKITYISRLSSPYVHLRQNLIKNSKITQNDTQCFEMTKNLDSEKTCNGEHMKCMNTLGSFYCKCSKGYNYNEKTEKCDDINECSAGNNSCWKGTGSIVAPYYNIKWLITDGSSDMGKLMAQSSKNCQIFC